MYPISTDIQALFEAGQRKVLSITGTDKNGAAINITDDNVIADSFQIDRYCCNGEKLEVGTAIAAQLMFTLENGDGTYDAIRFEGAELNVRVGVADWTQANPRVYWVPCGYFTPDEQPMRMSTISITALDRMTKFDVVVDAADLTFPTTVAGLVDQVCSACGVTLANSITGLPNASVSIAELPTVQDTLTYRTLIQWCAGIMATNAWFDWNGKLRFTWFSNAIGGYASTVDNRYSSNIYRGDLIVSGVEYTTTGGVPIVEGTDDYDIDITGNALAGPLIATVLPVINTEVNGFIYRPFTASAVNAPYLWPMDGVELRDKDNRLHFTTLTSVTFGLNGTTALEARGMTYVTNKAKYPKGFTREQAQLVNEAMTRVENDIDESLTQQEIFNRLTDNGAAQGLVLYNGQLYINASYIQSGTLVLGGLNNQNGTLRVLNAAGQEIGTWTKDGISISEGEINLSRTELGVTSSVQIWNNSLYPIMIDYSNNNYDYRTTLGGITPLIVRNNNDAHGFFVTPKSLRFQDQNGLLWFSVDKTENTSGDDEYRLILGQYSVGDVRAEINGDLKVYGDVSLVKPLSVGNGGTGATTAANARTNLEITPANIGAVSTSAVIDIPHGGTGATTSSVTISNDYSSILNVINAVRGTRIFPISIQKYGTSSYSDMPTGDETAEWNMELVGDAVRLTAFLFLYGQTIVYRRDFFNGSWLTGWTKIAPITPADIGAVNKAGDTMTGALTMNSNLFGALGSTGFRNVGTDGALSYLCTENDFYGTGGGWNHFIICNHGNGETYYNYVLRLPFYDSPKYKRQTGNTSAQTPWYDFLTSEKTVTVLQGGTGANYGTIDITDYCTFPTGNVNTSSPYGGRLYYNPYLNCVFGTIVMNDGASVANQADIVYLKKDSSGTVLSASREAACGTCVHSAVSPIAVPRITGNTIRSSHITVNSITSPRYTIMAFLG